MPQNVKIPLLGITRHTSHLNAADGEAAALINLTHRDGTLSPVPAQTPVYTLAPGRKLIYIHRNADHENWLTYDNTTLFYEAAENAGTITPTSGNQAIMQITGLRKIESIGNILILFSDEKKEYALYKESKYTYLGERPPMPDIQFSLYGSASCPERWCDIDPPMKDAFAWFDATNKNRVTTTVIGAINEELQYTRNVGRFSFPFFIRYALRLYNDTTAYYSPPILIIPSESLYVHITNSQNHDGKFTDFNYQVHKAEGTLKYDLKYDLGKWNDIIKSIDIYISDQIPRFNQNGEIPRIINDSGNWYLDLPRYTDNKTKIKVEETALFYLIHSIKLTSGINTSSGDIIPDNEKLNNLVHHEQAADDYNSHCTLVASNSFVYNSKLHMADIRQTLFPGFFPLHVTTNTNVPILKSIDTYTYIKTDNGDAIVCRHDELNNTRAYLNNYIYYPDPRAYKTLILFHTTTGNYQKEINLIPHKFLNGAYALLSIDNTDITYDLTTAIQPPVTKNTVQYNPNQLQVSELNNPFLFPVHQIYTVGNGRIVGLAAATAALSQGQFGQFPLYTFTDEGIWASQVGSSAYASQHPVTRDVCTNPHSITQLDNAIVFATDKGILLLSGSTTINLSEQLDGPVFDLATLPQLTTLLNNPNVVQLAHAISNTHFAQYLQTARIGYNYTQSEIIVSSTDPAINYTYVYSLLQKQWSIQAHNYRYLLNSYPHLYTTDTDNRIYNLSRPPRPEEVATPTPVLLITRPIKIIPDTYKRIVNLILRSNQQRTDTKQYITLLYGSNDTRTWALIAATQETDRTPPRPIAPHGTSCKYYIIVYAGTLLPASTISHIDALAEADYTNKLR